MIQPKGQKRRGRGRATLDRLDLRPDFFGTSRDTARVAETKSYQQSALIKVLWIIQMSAPGSSRSMKFSLPLTSQTRLCNQPQASTPLPLHVYIHFHQRYLCCLADLLQFTTSFFRTKYKVQVHKLRKHNEESSHSNCALKLEAWGGKEATTHKIR